MHGFDINSDFKQIDQNNSTYKTKIYDEHTMILKNEFINNSQIPNTVQSLINKPFKIINCHPISISASLSNIIKFE